ncbi:CG15337 [Drosophila busckii]|uniref:CG15337 n=1 Tax=Drosophila busckii TaxID=30019 RepID=A0A0M3QZ22_DROBS|nr:uncharacterized protein LOC108606964 [Drosophila busckii]ALC48673.1 CG15337 [Drosophila busckii]
MQQQKFESASNLETLLNKFIGQGDGTKAKDETEAEAETKAQETLLQEFNAKRRDELEPEPEPDIRLTPSNITLRADEHQQELQIIDAQIRLRAHTLRRFDEISQQLQQQHSWSSEARMLLFAAAADSDSYRSSLVPVPPLFMGNSYYDIEGVRRIVSSWPSCATLQQKLRAHGRLKSLAAEASSIELLHWVLVRQTQPKLRQLHVTQLRRICNKLQLKPPPPLPRPQQLLVVISHAQRSKAHGHSAWQHLYLACPLHLLYRLLATGDVDAQAAPQLRLYALPELALAQAAQLQAQPSSWAHSRFGRSLRCLLICQLQQSKQATEPAPSEFLISDASNLRALYLLFYDNENALQSAAAAYPNNIYASSSSNINEQQQQQQPPLCGFCIVAHWLLGRLKQLLWRRPIAVF